MALGSLFKLEKFTIEAYRDVDRRMGEGTFTALYNPESFSRRYQVTYFNNQGINSTGRKSNYARSEPSDLRVKLVLDGTGVHQSALVQLLGGQSVAQRVTEFLRLTFDMNGDTHEPNYLVAKWGDLSFSCRLGSVNVNYTRFNRDGTALRAELDVTLVADQPARKRLALENKSSPDLTHTRIVKSGDTLPLLARAVYGSSSYYLWVAEHNGLDDFRNLTPGQRLVFPPLDQGG